MNKAKKIVEIDNRAEKELNTFSVELQAKFSVLFNLLRDEGYLREPDSKRVSKNIFEVRVRYRGQ